jgi:hypothetical protein
VGGRHSLGQFLLVDLDQHPQTGAGIGIGDELLGIRDRPDPASTPMPFDNASAMTSAESPRSG